MIGYVDGYRYEIIDIEYGINDKLVLKDIDTNKTKKLRIYNNCNGSSYIRLEGNRVSMDNMIRL